jgi:hypothetical protein
MLLLADAIARPVFLPIMTLLDPVVMSHPLYAPNAILAPPVVLHTKEANPTAVLQDPVLHSNDAAPNAVFQLALTPPDVACEELYPTAVL